MTYKFQNLDNARSFVARAKGVWFIFHAEDSGYYVVDARTARQLLNDGMQDIR